MKLDEWLTTSPDYERPVAQKLLELAASLPDAHVEPVSVGLFVKRRSTFAQLRTMTKWTALTVKLTREVSDPKPSRRVQRLGSRWFHTYNLTRADDLSNAIIEMIEQAYEADA